MSKVTHDSPWGKTNKIHSLPIVSLKKVWKRNVSENIEKPNQN